VRTRKALKIKDKSARLRAGLLPRLATTFKSTADWIEARGCLTHRDVDLRLRAGNISDCNQRGRLRLIFIGASMADELLTGSGKTLSVDQKFRADVDGRKYSNHLFTRLVAKDRRFTKVNFRYSFFEHSYLRDCHFDSCDFTGCRFTNTNLAGSKFSGCTFNYAYFEKTLVEPAILETECPSYENLKLRFARTLRINFQQLGDAGAANKAMNVELAATATHLRKAAWSNEAYFQRAQSDLPSTRPKQLPL
jgi:uncharacterized protein YjbI with pentapeptide repeats